MKARIFNIRVMFVSFVGLMSGILFCVINFLGGFSIFNLLLFIFITTIISLGIFLYGFFTRKQNAVVRHRRKVSFLFMSSGVFLLIFSLLGCWLGSIACSNINKIVSYDGSVRVDGVVCDYVSTTSTYQKFVLKDCFIEYDGNIDKCDYKIIVYSDTFASVSLGDRLLIDDCEMKSYSPKDMVGLNKISQDIGYQTFATYDNMKISVGSGSLRDWVKVSVKDTLSENLSKDNSDIMYAMLFGEKEDLDDSVVDSFSYAGITHILAVSGLHVGVLSLLILFILNKIKVNKYLRLSIFSALLFFYAYLCSFSPSVCRAGLMSWMVALCSLLQIEYDGLSSISIAGIIILLFNPMSLFTLSFQLSFLSVFTIISLTPALNYLFEKIKLPKFLASSLSVSIAINLAILPLCANAFVKVSLMGVFTNILVLPLFTVTFICLFFIVLLSFVLNVLGIFLWLPDSFLHIIKVIANWSLAVDGLVYKLFSNGYLILIFVCLLALCIHFLMIKKLRKLAFVLPLIFIISCQLVVSNINYTADNNTLIFTHQFGGNIVFYAKEDNVTMVGSNIDCDDLLYTMKKLKIRKIDTVLAYDLQLNNISNLIEIIDECKCSKIYVPDKFNYNEITKKIDVVEYYSNDLEIMDMKFSSLEFEDQTIAIYLKIFEIGDILIPEVKPTKKEGTLISETYKDVDYLYQPNLSDNIDSASIGVKTLISNDNDYGISLSDLDILYLDKEYVNEV